MSVEMESTHQNLETDGTAKRVVDAFLGQYYEVMGNHPELVHKFYVDSSVIGRPASDGSMSSVTTLDRIDDLIQSLYAEGESIVEICTADAQFSYCNGIVILVTGLIGSEELKKRFSQMFFLAPQERGYYVLNDVFQYIGEEVRTPAAVVNDSASAAEEEETESTEVKVKAENGKKDSESAVVDKEVITIKSTCCDGQPNGKLTYASIIKAPAASAPASQSSPTAPKPSVKAPNSPSPVAVPAGPSSSITKEPSTDSVKKPSQNDDKRLSPPSKDLDQKVEVRSISVWELPLSIKPYQLDRSFSRKFGPVKQGGIQIRNAQGKSGPICYAFIEFESASSAESAIKASPVSIDGRPVTVKRKTNKGKYDGKQWTGSPQKDNNIRANGNPSNARNNGRHGDSSHDSNNAGHWNENGHINAKSSNGHAPPAKPEIDEDGFQTVSRNGKWKTQGN